MKRSGEITIKRRIKYQRRRKGNGQVNDRCAILIPVTEEQRTLIRKVAAAAGLGMAPWLRELALARARRVLSRPTKGKRAKGQAATADGASQSTDDMNLDAALVNTLDTTNEAVEDNSAVEPVVEHTTGHDEDENEEEEYDGTDADDDDDEDILE